eukprot:TRINITY_DN17278_c0_g1_i1.p1 TRINITY_DN17278_c0_g1~~TRINITY_DN17278_c0_g1_i1.p1  ORF type:complete len:186 (+),score=2.42 TRINITY_DN17278_c0_g1_i1:12-569(+)
MFCIQNQRSDTLNRSPRQWGRSQGEVEMVRWRTGLATAAACAALGSAQVIETRAPTGPGNAGFFSNVDASSPQMLADSFVVDAVDYPLGVTLGSVTWWGFVTNNENPIVSFDLSDIQGFQIDVYLADGTGGEPVTLLQSNTLDILDVTATPFGGPTDSSFSGQAFYKQKTQKNKQEIDKQKEIRR